MEDFSAPSFSLGLDLDADPDLSTEEEPDAKDGACRRGPVQEEEASSLHAPSSSGHHRRDPKEEDGLDFVLEALEEERLPPLKRLRRGPPPPRPPLAEPSTPATPVQCLRVVEGGVEEISSQEDCLIRDEYSSRKDHCACSSLKFSHHGQRVLTTAYSRKLYGARTKLHANGSASVSSETNNNKKPLLRSASPLRRIQLVDPDTDDLLNCKDNDPDVIEVGACCQDHWVASSHSVAKGQGKRTEILSGKLQSANLWKGTSGMKTINLATPALDEFCEDYFKDVNSSNTNQWSREQSRQTSTAAPSLYAPDAVDGGESHHEKSCISNSLEHNWKLPDPQPPSYQYFYHNDVEIQNLIRERLPSFVPLGDVKHMQEQQSNETILDYMSQFDQRKEPFQVGGGCEKELEGNSKWRSTNKKNTKDKKVADTSVAWVNPRSSITKTKNARKKMVHSAGHSSGHWYTGQDGRKVYVTKSGQELSGRIAYRRYRKESGAGFRKSRSRKKPAAAKRKAKR